MNDKLSALKRTMMREKIQIEEIVFDPEGLTDHLKLVLRLRLNSLKQTLKTMEKY